MAFIEEATRIIREKWTNVNMLAEEVYTLFGTWARRGLQGPVRITTPEGSTEPAVEYTALGDGPVFTINRKDGSTLSMNQDGSLTDTTSDDDEEVEEGDAEETPVVSGGGGLMGKIVSGSGTSYVVDLYASGLSAAVTGQVAATAPYLDSDEEIPAGTTVGVVVAGSVYHIQVLGYWL